MGHPEYTEILLEKHLLDQTTLQEEMELTEAIKKYTNKELSVMLDRIIERTDLADDSFFNQHDWAPVIRNIVRKKQRVIPLPRVPEPWLRYAAVLLIILGAGGIWLLSDTGAEQGDCHIKLPGKGEKNIVKMTIEHGIATLTVPRSWQYNLTLPDNSIVWLNAESSIRYTLPFDMNNRRIELIGEAFFEIAGDSSQPFYVKAGETEITAPGSRFNVSAYEGEESVKASLVSGSMSLESHGRLLSLMPGQEAVIPAENSHSSTPTVIADRYDGADWKDGYFSFAREKLPAIMRELARWYDWDVTYSDNIPLATLSGAYCRGTSESGMLAILADNGIKTEKTGRNIRVIQ